MKAEIIYTKPLCFFFFFSAKEQSTGKAKRYDSKTKRQQLRIYSTNNTSREINKMWKIFEKNYRFTSKSNRPNRERRQCHVIPSAQPGLDEFVGASKCQRPAASFLAETERPCCRLSATRPDHPPPVIGGSSSAPLSLSSHFTGGVAFAQALP